MAYKFRFRNIYGQSLTKWEDINPMGGTTDGLIAAGNSKFIAFPVQGGMGSCLGILGYDQAGRVKNIPQFQAHSSHITDFKFMPYNTNRIATCSQDSTIKLWEIKEENIADMKTPLADLQGHNLKVNLIAPHHSAKSIIASSSYDKTIKVWDWEEEKNILTFDQETHYALCLEWSFDGQLLGTTWNDSNVRLIDPRQNTLIREFQAHVGSRAQKFCWLGNSNHFVTTGVDKLQKRELGLWDVRNTSTHIKVVGCSQGQGVLHAYFDSDLGILYTNGKGEGTIRFFEYTNGNLTCHQNDYTVTDATKGYGFVEKQYVNPSISEIGRVIKLCNKYAEAVSIVYPRKSLDFQPDLFPDCSVEFGQSSSQWLEGNNAQPLKASMNTHQQPVAASSVRKASNALMKSPKITALSENNSSQIQNLTVQSKPIQEDKKQTLVTSSQPQVTSTPVFQPQIQEQPVLLQQQNQPQPVLTSAPAPVPTQLPWITPANTQVQAPVQNDVVVVLPQQPVFHKEDWQNCHEQLQQIEKLSNDLKQNFEKIQHDINDEEKDKKIEELTQKLSEAEGLLEQKSQEVINAKQEIDLSSQKILDLESSIQQIQSSKQDSSNEQNGEQLDQQQVQIIPNKDTETLENIKETLIQHKLLIESLEKAIQAQQQGEEDSSQLLLESSQAIIQGFQQLSGFLEIN